MTSLLDLLPDAPAEPAATETFEQWRVRNAGAVEHITRLALSAAARGARRLSAKSLMEAARAAGAFGEPGVEPFRLNNNRTADLARWLMERYPTPLGGKFEIRRRRV